MFLCVDLGSTSFKAAVYDGELRRLGEGQSYLDYAEMGERVEIEPFVVETAACEAVASALRAAGLTARSVTGVAITSQAQTVAIRVAGGGAFRTRFVSRQDRRADALAEAMKRMPLFEDFARHASFFEPLGGLMICLLKALVEADPALSQSEAVPLPSAVIERLTGALVLDENLAAMTGLWSLEERRWRGPWVAWLGWTEERLPRVMPLLRPAGGAWAGNPWSLPPGCPVFCAGNDQTAGAFSAELERERAALVTLGSAQVVYQWTADCPPPAADVIRGVYPGGGYYRMMADIYGGHLISRTVRQCGLRGFDQFFDLAKQGVAAGAPLPALRVEAERLVWDDEQKASAAARCAAVLDFLNERMAGYIGRLQGGPSGALYLADSGGARNNVWRRGLERKLGQEIRLKPAAPTLGAARMLALAGVPAS